VLEVGEPEMATSQFRADLLVETGKYIEEKYRKGKALFAVTQGDNDDHQIIEISCQNYKLESFWTGEWLSTFSVKDGVLSGDLKIRCHYFEMGNMQFNLDKQFDSIPCSDASNPAEVLKAISYIENKVSEILKNSVLKHHTNPSYI
jgi:capping protein alpha